MDSKFVPATVVMQDWPRNLHMHAYVINSMRRFVAALELVCNRSLGVVDLLHTNSSSGTTLVLCTWAR